MKSANISSSAMPTAYDHFSYIHQPPAFALELGSMVAAQHGPCGRVSKLDSHHGDVKVNSRRKAPARVSRPSAVCRGPLFASSKKSG